VFASASGQQHEFHGAQPGPKESWKNKETNEWESRTEWHRILVFGKLADFAATLSKGAHIEVEGALRSREQTIKLKGSAKKNRKRRTSGLGRFAPNLFASSIAPRSPVKIPVPMTFRFDRFGAAA
jgi:Single-strand binding protein family